MNDDHYTVEEDIPSWQSYSLEDIEEDIEEESIEKNSNDAEDEAGNSAVNQILEQGETYSFLRLAGLMLKLMLSPVEGWKNFKRLKIPFQTVNAKLLFPLAGLAAAASFLNALFYNDKDIKEAIPVGLGIFCSLFFGFFCTYLFSKLLLTKEGKEAMERDFGRSFISMIFSTMSLFAILYEAIQVLQPIMVFLPLWTIYLILKGVRFIGIPPQQQTRTATILSVLALGFPLGVDWLMSIAL